MLTSPRRNDLPIITALASDPDAQRWLGWRTRQVMSARQMARARASRPGGEYLVWKSPPYGLTLAIEPDVVAGQVVLQKHHDFWHLGIHLAAELRNQGHGRRALQLAAEFFHRHLGLGTIFAGTHPDNLAAQRALAAAGFVPAPGPAEFELPNGEVIPTHWTVHTASASGRCRWLTLSDRAPA